MPGDDADFAAYLSARWPSLIRSLVLMGCGRAEAVEVARSGLARCCTDWERVRRADDVDVHVYAEVIGCLRRRRRAAEPEVPPDEELTDEVRLRRGLDAQLRARSADERTVLVLRFVAELSEIQVADVLDVRLDDVRSRAAGPPAPADTFRRAGESIAVPEPPVAEIVAEARDRRRRRWRTVVIAVAAAAFVLGVLTWVANREPPAPPELAPAPITREANPVRVAWYADGELHLEKVVVEVPGVTDLVELNGGAVYGDRDGTVAFVVADGERRRIGEKVPEIPMVASSAEGWVAWVDPHASDGGEGSTLRVYDVSQGAQLASMPLASGDARPIAIDQQKVFFEEAGDAYAWTPPDGTPEPVTPAGLVDVDAGNRVYQRGRSIVIEQSFFSVSYVRPGAGGQLSDGGILVLSKEPGVGAGVPFEPLLYDARSGDRKLTGIRPDERAVDATFGRNNTAIYLVGDLDDLRSGSAPLLVLRSCDLTSSRCTDVAPVPTGSDQPVLAH